MSEERFFADRSVGHTYEVVLASTYDALEARCERLVEALEELRDAMFIPNDTGTVAVTYALALADAALAVQEKP